MPIWKVVMSGGGDAMDIVADRCWVDRDGGSLMFSNRLGDGEWIHVHIVGAAHWRSSTLLQEEA